MKRYLVFLLFVMASLQVIGQSSCKINHFYQQGTTTDITEVVYGAPFDMELVVSYNPLEQATDKLRTVVQLPTGDNYTPVIAAMNANPIIISSQYFDHNQHQLTVDITGFSKTLQSTFTINVYNVTISPVISCAPIAFTTTSSLQYYTNDSAVPVDFPNNQFPSIIYGKHITGSITTSIVNQFGYSSSTDAQAPLYVDLQVNTGLNTYPSTAVLLNFNSNITIKKVTADNSIALTTTIGSKLYYTVPKYSSYIRVYFDLPENSAPVSLSLTGEAMFSACQGEAFPIIPVTASFTGKPDNAILSYPSLYTSINYMNASGSFYTCGGGVSPFVYLDNVYNSPLNVEQPIVVTADINGNIQAEELIYRGVSLPDKVYVRICGNTAYETTPLTYSINNGSYLIPPNITIDKIRVEFLHLESEVALLMVSCKSISGNQCMGTNLSVVFNLLKNEESYMTKSFGLSLVPASNYIALNYPETNLIPNQKITPHYLFLQVYNTLQPTDYISYTLSDNMTFPDDYNLQLRFDNTNFIPIAAFNTQYFNSNPITYTISTDRKKLTITNITIAGRYSNCSTLPYNLYIQITSQVASRPTSISNTNVFALKNSTGTDLLQNAPYDWTVVTTQSVTNTVFFSCDGGTTRTAGITIKKDDAVNVYYTLENTTLYKYDQKPFAFYCTLPTTGVQPALLLVKLSTIGNITIPTILPPNSYSVSYANGNLDDYATLTYVGSVGSNNILKVTLLNITLDAYEKLILSLAYPEMLGLSSNNGVRFYAKVDGLTIPPQSSALTIGPKSDCDLFNCAECVTSFSPLAGEEYIISAWVKETFTGNTPTAYKSSGIRITFNDGAIADIPLCRPTGPIVDGWQRIEYAFTVPSTAKNIHVALVNEATASDAYVFFDDIRIHPYNSNMKSFVYDPSTQKLTAELDENNFATLYEYDDEGILIRVKKETERGVMTIKETRSNQSKVQSNKIK